MMSVNKNNVDIALAMGFSDHTVKTKLNDDSGAGVNAGSGLHIFAAPDPLSELVWTPGKGLSLKCADNSLAKKKPILLWNVAPSNEVSSPPEIIRFDGINDEKDIGEGSTNGMENINPAEVDGNVDTDQNKESQRENEEKDLSVLQTIGEGERDSIPPQESDKKVAVKEERSKRKMQICCHKRKGKGKASSDSDDSNDKMSSSEEGSHESVESCNSARIFPESKNLENFEQPLYSGSKRVKTQMQMQRNVAPTSTVGHGSSFFTWISNMVNGLSKPSHKEVPLLALAVAHSNLGHEGNHNIWSTFAIPEIRISKDDISAGESKDVLVDDKMVIDVSPTQCPWENDGSDEQILVSNDKIITSASANVEGVSTKSKDMPSYALNDDASICFDNNEKSIHKLNPIIPFPKFKSSEAMTCLFAKRLEALKHNIPPDTRNEATCKKAICLFCGKSGDGFCNCSEATESDAFLAKEEGTYNIIVNHIGRCKEKSGIVTDTNNLAQTRESISAERNARSSDVPENVALNPGENVLKGTGVLPLPTFGSKETASVPKGAFDAIRRLRLSRGDILKWLDSNAPLSHLDGFFLRLRMGKWEGALGGTGYYIARITGSQQEYSAKDAKKCISVSICGITCSVGSQYISNHDFLEDELMAWWCKTSENGGQVPSEDELRLKVEQRMKLGF